MSFLSEHYREFLAHMRDLRGASETTVETYRIVLEDAVNLVDVNEATDPVQIDLMPYRIKIAGQCTRASMRGSRRPSRPLPRPSADRTDSTWRFPCARQARAGAWSSRIRATR